MQGTHDVRLVGVLLSRTEFAPRVAADFTVRTTGMSDPRPSFPRIGGKILMGLAMLCMQLPGVAVAAPGAAQVSRMRGADGPTLLAEIVALAIIILAAALVVFFLRRRFAHEIAVHEQAARSLEASKDEARAIIDTAYDAFIEIDDEGSILQWNRAAESTFGWIRQEVLGKQVADLILPVRYRQAHRRRIQDLLALGTDAVPTQKNEVEALHRDGHEFPIEVSLWPNRSGGTIKINLLLHDISERQRVAQRQAAQGRAAAALVASATVAEAAPKLLGAVCTALGWAVGALWTVDRNTNTLRCVEYWRQSETERPTFETVTWATTFVRGTGLPGRV